ncbi:hypothetical protein BJV74DRAFT_882710 [Russula compacta]|nr:hypothetical protein BJV74DRAFT_882710 [Russula compacta]
MAQTADEKFAAFVPGYHRTYFPGAHHGFATRGDLKDPTIKAAKEGAFKGVRGVADQTPEVKRAGLVQRRDSDE